MHRRTHLIGGGLTAATLLLTFACADQASDPTAIRDHAIAGNILATNFTPLPTSVTCTNGGNPSALFSIPAGYVQANTATMPDFVGNPDMITENETGPDAGRFMYQTHELGLGTPTGVSVTDLQTGLTHMVVTRTTWGSLDGIKWTPWGSVVFAEERAGGQVWELNPTTGEVMARPALGLKSHEGMAFDNLGNMYGISENNPGFIFKFVPDNRNSLKKGQLYALKVTAPTGDRTGGAVWVPLDRAAVQINANTEAQNAGATGYNRPEDLEFSKANNTLFAALTGPSAPADNRVIGIDLSDPANPFVFDYVKWGVNVVQGDFEMPDNVTLDHSGNLYITEDPATAPNTKRGDDIWFARPGGLHQPAASVVRFASLTDCQSEPTGVYVDLKDNRVYVHAQHRGGDGLDKTVMIKSGN